MIDGNLIMGIKTDIMDVWEGEQSSVVYTTLVPSEIWRHSAKEKGVGHRR